LKRKKLIYFVTEDWYFCLHWLRIAEAAQAAGFDVSVVTRVRDHGGIILQAGLTLIPFEISRQGMNPLRELATIARLARIYRRCAADLVHNVAMKPTLYGSLAARLAGSGHVVNTLAGLGWLFTSPSLVARILKKAVITIFSQFFVHSVIVLQNHDDAAFMKSLGLKCVKVVRGAGVDITKFSPVADGTGRPVVILPARMLWDKGIREFVAAARMLVDRGVSAAFVLVGGTDTGNPAAVASEQLEKWVNEGVVEWWGQRNDMPEVYKQADIVCLPSYREGLPTVLIEAAACSRPIVTTDTVGCREVVRQGENGYLVPVGSTVELADALQLLLEDSALRNRLGTRGREIAVQEFAVERIIVETQAVYEELLSK
jgi:glycosyltransferase involved in cell wall biosynthesis